MIIFEKILFVLVMLGVGEAVVYFTGTEVYMLHICFIYSFVYDSLKPKKGE